MALISSILKVFVGDKSKVDLKAIQPVVDAVKRYGSKLETLSNDELRKKTTDFKNLINANKEDILKQIEELQKQALECEDVNLREDIYKNIDELSAETYRIDEKTLNEILPEAFAVVKETARRFASNTEIKVTATAFDRFLSQEKTYVHLEGESATWKNSWSAAGKEIVWDMVHYDVQIIGGIALHNGKIAEMQTGEGKTLVSTLPLYLNALTGRGVHLVTVNDYLARRDSSWMGPLFEFHGLSVDCIDNYEANSEERRKAYASDITYGTNNEFGFDYLRDNMAHSPIDLVQKYHNYAIVDEVDSVLVDDARTPLIISGPVPEGGRHEFTQLKPKIEDIVTKQRQYLNGVLVEAKKMIADGKTKEGGFLLFRVYRGLPKNKALIKYLSEEGIKQLLQKVENYHMQDNNKEMPKVDEELLFVIDEKNNQIDLTEKGLLHLSGANNDKDFFILPDIGAEIAQIEAQKLPIEKEAELKDAAFKDFSIKSERIHTMHQLLKAYTLFEKDVEYVVMNNKVLIVDEQTGRILSGRRYSDGLHQAIEAKENVKIEAITQTFATITLQNYFRMYSKLAGMTGTAITEAGEFWEIYKLDVVEIPTNKPVTRKDYNDLIYKTKREKYNALIEEVVDLSAKNRSVLIGTTSVEVSELLSKMLLFRKIKHNVLNAKLHKKESEIVAEAGQPGVVTIATNMAGRGTDIKLNALVKEAGGLAIIGTERHDSRRVDRQLRGRSGRQGDPGSSQFYVSLEDNLMRLFGSERIARIMDRMGVKEGEVIQHSMMTKSIERAQKKVEQNNFGIRKRLLEYDDIMNSQREVIYKRRKHALNGERLTIDISNMIYDVCELITISNKEGSSFKNFEFELIKYFSITSPISDEEFAKMSPLEVCSLVYKSAYNHYKEKTAAMASTAFSVIKEVYNSQPEIERVVVPFSDGIKTMSVLTNLNEAYESEGRQIVLDFEKNISLVIIDETWKTHLRQMDELRQSVQLAVHEQKDPLLIYKFEAFELFKVMIDKVNKEIISFLFKADLPSRNPNEIREARAQRRSKEALKTSKEDILNLEEISERYPSPDAKSAVEPVMRQSPKIGRNDVVNLVNTITGETKSLKYKQAQPFLEKSEWVISEK